MNLSSWRKGRPHLIPCIIASGMLLLSLADWPYGYCQLLRLVVTAAAVFVTIVAFKSKKIWAVWTFGFVALLFNPVAPVHLSRATWFVFDAGTAVLFVVSCTKVRIGHASTDAATKERAEVPR
jgi:hypothetical protein